MIAIGLAIVAFTISNDWGTLLVILGLLVLGLGEGTMLTLLFNVLVSASPKELAGDVGALRGVANNVSSALGAAFAGVVAVGVAGPAHLHQLQPVGSSARSEDRDQPRQY